MFLRNISRLLVDCIVPYPIKLEFLIKLYIFHILEMQEVFNIKLTCLC
jgi:hypothetical protein